MFIQKMSRMLNIEKLEADRQKQIKAAYNKLKKN